MNWSNVSKVAIPDTGLGKLLEWNGGSTREYLGNDALLYWWDPSAVSVASGKCRVAAGFVDDVTGRYEITSISCTESNWTDDEETSGE